MTDRLSRRELLQTTAGVTGAISLVTAAGPLFQSPDTATAKTETQPVVPSKVTEVYPSPFSSLQTTQEIINHFDPKKEPQLNVPSYAYLNSLNEFKLAEIRDQEMKEEIPQNTRSLSIIVSDRTWNRIEAQKEKLGIERPEEWFEAMVDAANEIMAEGRLRSHKVMLREIIRVADSVAPNWQVQHLKRQYFENPEQPGNWRYHLLGGVQVPQRFSDDLMIVHPADTPYPDANGPYMRYKSGALIDIGWIYSLMLLKEQTWGREYTMSGQVFLPEQSEHLKRVHVQYQSITGNPTVSRISGCDQLLSELFAQIQPDYRGILTDITEIGGWRNPVNSQIRMPASRIYPKEFRLNFKNLNGSEYTREKITDGYVAQTMDGSHGAYRFDPNYFRNSDSQTNTTFILNADVARYTSETYPLGGYDPNLRYIDAYGYAYMIDGVIYHIPVAHLNTAAILKMYNIDSYPTDPDVTVRLTITLAKDPKTISKPTDEYIETVRGKPLIAGNEDPNSPNSAILAYYRIGSYGGETIYGIICDRPIHPESVVLEEPPPPPVQDKKGFIPVVSVSAQP